MLDIYIDADACPVKEETYRVARRYSLKVFVVSNSPMRVPGDAEAVVLLGGFGLVDDWIAERIGAGDVAITADIPLAERCLLKRARVIDPKGRPFTDDIIGGHLASRTLMDELRQSGVVRGGPSAMTKQDRSRFLAKLDETIHAIRKHG